MEESSLEDVDDDADFVPVNALSHDDEEEEKKMEIPGEERKSLTTKKKKSTRKIKRVSNEPSVI